MIRDFLATDPTMFARLMNPLAQTGWTEWGRQRTGRFTERVIERRRNPFGQMYPELGVFYGVGYLGIESGVAAAVFGTAGVTGLRPESLPYWEYAPLTAIVPLALFLLGGVYARLRTRCHEQVREASQYPPAAYWTAVNGGEA